MADSSLRDNADIGMGQSPRGDTCNTEGQGLPLLNGPTEFGPHHPTPVQFTTDARKRAQIGDVLFCVRGSTTGRMNWADREYAIGRGVAAIRHKKNPELQPFVRAVIEYGLTGLLAQATGSTFPNVSADQLANLWWPQFEYDEQLAIAHILGTLDDKIDLNRRMNETLEAMARALFKSWSVDFDPVRAKAGGRDTGLPKHIDDFFPDSFEDSELGEIPKGWGVAEIGDIADVIDCLHAKKPDRCDAGRSFLQLNNIRDDGLIDITDTYFINNADYQKWTSRMEATKGDCVITNVGRVGAVAQIPDSVRAALGRNMTGIRCKPAYPYPTFLIECLLSDTMRQEITRKMDSGTILNALNVRNIPKLRFVQPDYKLMARFEQAVRPLRQKMEQTLCESRSLVALRDTLLPKLISGEMRVKDAEKFAEAAV